MKVQKIQNKLLQYISEIIINDLQNPKIGFVTIVAVKTSKDLDLATVYINVLGQKEKKEASLKALEKSIGFIKSSLAKKIKIRKIPKLKFVLDATLENANSIEKALNKIKRHP